MNVHYYTYVVEYPEGVAPRISAFMDITITDAEGSAITGRLTAVSFTDALAELDEALEKLDA